MTWRGAGGKSLAEHDPERLIGVVKNILPTDTKISDLEQLKEFIDSFCAAATPARDRARARGPRSARDHQDGRARSAGLHAGKPGRSTGSLPYTTHVFKVDLLFYLGIDRGFISGERASNQADMAYLYYLPFAMVFVSGDELHRRTVPLFLSEDQSYLDIEEMKAALASSTTTTTRCRTRSRSSA